VTGSTDRCLDGKTCLVTGGGRGIGRGVAEALAGLGAVVAVASRTVDECEVAARGIGRGAFALECDVTSYESCVAAVEDATRGTGGLDVLVHAAGISPLRARAEQHDPEAFALIQEVNAVGAFNISHAAASALFTARGVVVFVSSVLGVIGSSRLAGYGASKAAVNQLARTLAREWADRGVRVNAVAPGYVPTALTAGVLANEHLRSEIVRAVPMGRLAELQEIVAPIVFLATPSASYVTGATLIVDGGMAA